LDLLLYHSMYEGTSDNQQQLCHRLENAGKYSS